MKIWLFTFTQEERELLTARIAAPTPDVACGIMSHVLKRPLIYGRGKHPEPGTIMTYLGQEDLPDARIRSLVRVDGSEIVDQ